MQPKELEVPGEGEPIGQAWSDMHGGGWENVCGTPTTPSVFPSLIIAWFFSIAQLKFHPNKVPRRMTIIQECLVSPGPESQPGAEFWKCDLKTKKVVKWETQWAPEWSALNLEVTLDTHLSYLPLLSFCII